MYLYNALLWILKETRLKTSLNFTPSSDTHKDLQSTAIVAYSILKRLIQVPKGAKKIALQSEVPLVLQLGGLGRVDWSGSGAPCEPLGPPKKRVIHSKHFFEPTHANSKMSNRPQNKFQQCKTVWLVASLFVLVFFSLRNMFLFEWDRWLPQSFCDPRQKVKIQECLSRRNSVLQVRCPPFYRYVLPARSVVSDRVGSWYRMTK